MFTGIRTDNISPKKLDRQTYGSTSHTKGKASTAKQISLGTLLGLELNLHCVMTSSFWRHPCQLDLSQRYRATRPQSSANVEISLPDDNVTRSAYTWGVVAT